MKKIAIIIPYFGTFPKMFDLFLKSAEKNETIDFLIFTDNDIQGKNNIYTYMMSFNEFKEKAQKCFDFKISLDFPYKICDYKPAFGEIFKDYLKEYDFWGWCDIDLILGDIRKFCTDAILDEYVRIGTIGPFSIFKNNEYTNKLYRTLQSNNCQNYKSVYSQRKNRAFDEWAKHMGYGISMLFEENNIKQYGTSAKKLPFADMHILSYGFISTNKYIEEVVAGKIKKLIFDYKNGKLFAVFLRDNEVRKIELLYAHFEKRKLDFSDDLADSYLIIPPNKAINKNGEIDKEFLKKIKTKGFYSFKYKWLLKRSLIKLGIIKEN